MRTTNITRRDQCYLVGKRMAGMNVSRSAAAWAHLAQAVYNLGAVESVKLPKYANLLGAIRTATIKARGKQ